MGLSQIDNSCMPYFYDYHQLERHLFKERKHLLCKIKN